MSGMKERRELEETEKLEQIQAIEADAGSVEITELSGEKDETYRVLELALEAGRILLRNGGEIFRVEETVWRICENFGVKGLDTFVLSNGIFVAANHEGRTIYARMRHVPLSGAHLGIVAEVNELSRKIAAGKVGLEEAFLRLEEIKKIQQHPLWLHTLASGMGAGGFCYIMGATVAESGATFFIGVFLHLFMTLLRKGCSSKVLLNTLGGAFITVLAICGARFLPFGFRIDKMITGAIMPLVPGVAFVNAIRDIADNDILSGTVRMVDAILVFVYIAVGAGAVLTMYQNLMGGILV